MATLPDYRQRYHEALRSYGAGTPEAQKAFEAWQAALKRERQQRLVTQRPGWRRRTGGVL